MRILINRTPQGKTWVIEHGPQTIQMGTEAHVLSVLNVHPSKIYHEITGDIRKAYVQEKLARVVASYLNCKTKELITKWEQVVAQFGNK